ncbi:50S ribosomal protein L10 [Candidatus Azambacteria bacterium]|nr:50S ribosomal protein L10 [Candidatus Azambacteria bacterium]
MPLTKKQKGEIINSVVEKFSKSKTLIFTYFTKISVEKIKKLRKNLKMKGSDFKVIKKSLLGVALEKAKINIEGIDVEKAFDAVGVVFGGKDQIQIARAVSVFARAKSNETFKVLGGAFDGQFAGVEKITALARMSSQEELYARLLGQFKAPLSRLAYVLKAVSEKRQPANAESGATTRQASLDCCL